MSLFQPVKLGAGTCAIGVCDRCKMRYNLDELKPDGNSPGLRVCDQCNDVLDPWKKPARPTENISLNYPRPDVILE